MPFNSCIYNYLISYLKPEYSISNSIYFRYKSKDVWIVYSHSYNYIYEENKNNYNYKWCFVIWNYMNMAFLFIWPPLYALSYIFDQPRFSSAQKSAHPRHHDSDRSVEPRVISTLTNIYIHKHHHITRPPLVQISSCWNMIFKSQWEERQGAQAKRLRRRCLILKSIVWNKVQKKKCRSS